MQKFCKKIKFLAVDGQLLSSDGTLHLDTFLWQINRNHYRIHDNIVTFHFLLVAKYSFKCNNLKLHNYFRRTNLILIALMLESEADLRLMQNPRWSAL